MQSAELLLGSAIGLFTSFLWAISTNVYKSQSDEATPLAIAALKMWVAMTAMTLVALLPFRSSPFYMPFNSMLFLIASVAIGLVVGDFVYLISQERIGVSYAFPITSTYPILTYVMAVAFVGEVVIISRIVGILVAVGGIILISRSQSLVQGPRDSVIDQTAEEAIEHEGRGKTDWLGIGLALLAAVCWATGSILLQEGVEAVDPIDANLVRMFFGSAIFVPVVLGAVVRGMPVPSRRAARIVALAALFGMTLGSLLYTYTVKLVGAAVAALMGSASPLFALPISILVLKEGFSSRSLLGALLTVAGVVLVVVAA
jgi:DME family drug/metabolite transporter